LKRSEKFGSLSSEGQLLITKLLGVFYGVIIIGVTYVISQIGGIIQLSMALNGAAGGPLLGLFCLGFFVRQSNSKGAIVGVVLGVLGTMWFSLGALFAKKYHPILPSYTNSCQTFNHVSAMKLNLTAEVDTLSYDLTTTTPAPAHPSIADMDWSVKIYQLSFLLYPIIGCFFTFLVGIIVSICTGGQEKVNEQLLHPFIRRKVKKENDYNDNNDNNVKCTKIQSLTNTQEKHKTNSIEVSVIQR